MNREQFQRARRLFDEVMTHAADARAVFLLEACPDDPDVRAEVDRLLRQGTEASPMSEIRGAIRDAITGTVGTGSVVSHYRLEDKIGEGGMGQVYRATDLALGRDTAIKVLPTGLSGAHRDRLLAEARTSARLQHPGIATFYEGGETDDGVAFLAMELVHGETLRERLRRGPMPVDEALRTAAALLEALAHAHACDVIHRDIKPENVMIGTDGRVKLLDLGIAKRVDVAELDLEPEAVTLEATRTAMTALTRHGSVVGTIGYMPPEQLRGEPVDARVDLFAVGAVLYEMIAGRPAFRGRSAAERIAATVAGDLPELDVSEAGADLGAVIQRALAREPSERYGSASDLLRDVQAVASGEAIAILPDTLAILEFTVAGSTGSDWIGGAVTEALAADLAGVDGLIVLPREKVARARAGRTEPDSRQVGLVLGCRWVLDGTVQRIGPALRITHRLIEVATGNVSHTDKLDGDLDALFELQDRVADSIADHLHVVLPERTNGPSADHVLDAEECYARGTALVDKADRGTLDEAEILLRRAVELDPSHARALSRLAWIHAPARWVVTCDPSMLDLAESFARRAVQADPKLPDGHVTLGYALWRRNERARAIDAFDEADRLAPNHPWANYFAACVLVDLERFEQARDRGRRAIRRSEAGAFSYAVLGFALLLLGDLDEALWTLTRASEMEAAGGPINAVGTKTWIAECQRRMGRHDDARRSAIEAIEIIEASDHFFRDVIRPQALCILARVAEGQDELDAARAALTQCIAHVRGRRAGAGHGYILVRAMAIRARIDRDVRLFREAMTLFLERREYNFSWGGPAAHVCRDDLADTARILGKSGDVEQILAANRLD